MAQKKIINECAFPEKLLQADIRCSEREKKFVVENTSLGKIFRLVLVGTVP